MEIDFVGAFELEYGRMVDFSKIIVKFILNFVTQTTNSFI